MGNQSVLLAGVNDCPRIMRVLLHKLVQNRVRPYYLYQCDLSEGLSHFRTPVGKGIEILESLIGAYQWILHTRLMLLMPQVGVEKYLSCPIILFPGRPTRWFYGIMRVLSPLIKSRIRMNPFFVTGDCENCELQLNLEDADENKAIGIRKLLSDYDRTISLIPAENERYKRRDEDS